MQQRIITVFGSATPTPEDAAYHTAYALGHAIAQAGWTLCNGGYGGTMEAAAKGARDAGGEVIGVTCSSLPGRSGANPYVSREMVTPDLLTRLNTLVGQAEAFVVLPGGTGTLLELALVWELLNKELIDGTTPLILLGDHWTPVLEPIRAAQPVARNPLVVPDVRAAIAHLVTHFGREPVSKEGASGPGQ